MPGLIEQQMPASPYGARTDGSPKGTGFFGELPRPDGNVSTELAVGVNFDDQEMEIPLLVPSLTRAEIDHLLQDGKPTDAIMGKAVLHARKRLAQKLSPFASDDERFDLPEPEAGQ